MATKMDAWVKGDGKVTKSIKAELVQPSGAVTLVGSLRPATGQMYPRTK